MKVWKLLILPVLVLLLLGLGESRAENNPAAFLCFQGETLKVEGNLLIKDQSKYLSLAFITKQLPVTAVWQSDTGVVRLKSGLNTYELQEDQVSYRSETTVKQLAASPFEAAGQLWVPVSFLTAELGLAVQEEDERSLVLEWAGNYLVAVEPETYEGRPAIALVGTKPLQYNSFALYEPERVVIDLSGFKAYPGLDTTTVSNQLIKKLRFSQFQPDTLRLVADLTQKCGYQLIYDPQNANRALLVFNYLVQNVNVIKQDGVERVQIKTSYPAAYKVFQLSRPLRTVIDFTGATLAVPQSVVEAMADANGNYFKRVRISQFDPQTVRVVMDLADTNWRYQVIPSRKDPTIIEARTVQRVRTIECLEPTSEITRLVLTGSGELDETVRKLKAPARLQIDLDFFQFEPSLHQPVVERLSQIKGLKLQTLTPTSVRIEAELKYLAGYDVKLSEDYQQLVVTLTKSPLIGKTFVIDPGHGGVDSGAVGKQGLREKDINFEVALRLQDLLVEAGANGVLTRNGDYYIGLYERNFIANQLAGDMFISIHSNFHPNPNVHGIEVYAYQDMVDSALLAKLVESQLVKQTNLPGLGVKYNDFVVIRESIMPSILVEMGYLSYGPEEALMKTAKFRDQAALGIYKGIIAYYYTRQSDKNQK